MTHHCCVQQLPNQICPRQKHFLTEKYTVQNNSHHILKGVGFWKSLSQIITFFYLCFVHIWWNRSALCGQTMALHVFSIITVQPQTIRIEISIWKFPLLQLSLGASVSLEWKHFLFSNSSWNTTEEQSAYKKEGCDHFLTKMQQIWNILTKSIQCDLYLPRKKPIDVAVLEAIWPRNAWQF